MAVLEDNYHLDSIAERYDFCFVDASSLNIHSGMFDPSKIPKSFFNDLKSFSEIIKQKRNIHTTRAISQSIGIEAVKNMELILGKRLDNPSFLSAFKYEMHDIAVALRENEINMNEKEQDRICEIERLIEGEYNDNLTYFPEYPDLELAAHAVLCAESKGKTAFFTNKKSILIALAKAKRLIYQREIETKNKLDVYTPDKKGIFSRYSCTHPSEPFSEAKDWMEENLPYSILKYVIVHSSDNSLLMMRNSERYDLRGFLRLERKKDNFYFDSIVVDDNNQSLEYTSVFDGKQEKTRWLAFNPEKKVIHTIVLGEMEAFLGGTNEHHAMTNYRRMLKRYEKKVAVKK